MSDYILTYSKTKFFPLEPVFADIHIVDIAHSLSLMTRANGHFTHFYSVAQHAINCCKEAQSRSYSERVQLGCLLHDASESYISDLTRPVKRNLPEYFRVEEKLQGLIYERFGLGDLSEAELKQIEAVDDALLHFEFAAMMGIEISDIPPEKTMDHDCSQRDFIDVEKEFLRLFRRLTGEKGGFACVGVDGCKEGWIAVAITEGDVEVDLFPSVEAICLKYGGSDCILIDMPIGLPEDVSDIRPDGAARRILSTRASSVFSVPCRQALYARDYSEANAINRRVMGKGLSHQAFNICGKIKEIDLWLERNPSYKNRLLESHPELCFTMLNAKGEEKIPISENKRTEAGREKRLSLLKGYYDKTSRVEKIMNEDPRLRKMKDDVIDALCLAVTGMLGMKYGLKTIPEKPTHDRRCIPMQIVCVEIPQ
ncbi:DUF429 domain-containing protein [Heliobacillus mobilis]|uniref:DUF429 domain-containing protein n=1 Tax=Heliobacterium mobile TaxID=28064 RepID=A0A6I3SHG0_HELMO|nr:DUF429 domain-containing protein [Heliobacterium mobile]MTV48280.1 DUF429 domain-containing protein [Heliobacterium mobile]